MLGLARIALVERRLADDHRPLGALSANRPQRRQHVLLGVVHGLQHHDDAMRLVGEDLQVLGRIVAHFAQSAGVEELQEAAFFVGIGIHGGRPRAGAKALADFGVVAAGQCADDRSLALLHFAQHPEDGRGQRLPGLGQDVFDLPAIDLRRNLLPQPEPVVVDQAHTAVLFSSDADASNLLAHRRFEPAASALAGEPHRRPGGRSPPSPQLPPPAERPGDICPVVRQPEFIADRQPVGAQGAVMHQDRAPLSQWERGRG